MEDEYLDLPYVGEILEEEFLQPLGLSQSDVAKAIFVPRARISDVINGKRAVTPDTDLRLAKFFGVSEGYFLRIQERLQILQAKRNILPILNDIHPVETISSTTE